MTTQEDLARRPVRAIEIDSILHRRLKIMAAEREETLRELTERLIGRAMAAEGLEERESAT